MSESDPSPSTLVEDSPLKRKRGVDDLTASQQSSSKAQCQSATPPKMATAAKKLSLSTPQSFVTFVVGRAKETFVVHKAFATSQCQDFERAFNDPSRKECQTQTMELPDIEPEEFGHLVHWLYFKEVDVDEIARKTILFDLWDMASRFNIVGLRSYALRMVKEVFPTLNEGEKKIFIDWVYCNEKLDDKLSMAPIRKLIVDMVAWGMEPEKLGELRDDDTPPGFWVNLALVMSKHVWDRLPTKYFGKVGSTEYYMSEESEVKKE